VRDFSGFFLVTPSNLETLICLFAGEVALYVLIGISHPSLIYAIPSKNSIPLLSGVSFIIAFLYEGLLPEYIPILFTFPSCLIVFTFSTFTSNISSIALFISALFALGFTKNVYLLSAS